MKQQFLGWPAVVVTLRAMAIETNNLNQGQCASLHAIADRIASHGMLIADEVGLGKTRIAVALAQAVIACGGRVAVLIPPGLGYQWQAEFAGFGREVPEVLRSLSMFHQRWSVPVQKPWFEEDVVLISHFFCRWTFKKNSQRFMLLPELYARWVQKHTRRPNGYSEQRAASCEWGGRSAPGIVGAVPEDAASPAHAWLQELADKYTHRSLLNSIDYQKDGKLRHELERAVGLGLGLFDLVLIDEAHKSRGRTACFPVCLRVSSFQRRKSGGWLSRRRRLD